MGQDYHDDRHCEAHIDLLNVLAGYAGGAARPKLCEIAAACGIPSKLGMSGDKVADMYLAGRMVEIAEYNESDALTTHLLMLKVALHGGKLSHDEYAVELAAAESFLSREVEAGKASMAWFPTEWATLQADPIL